MQAGASKTQITELSESSKETLGILQAAVGECQTQALASLASGHSDLVAQLQELRMRADATNGKVAYTTLFLLGLNVVSAAWLTWAIFHAR